MKGRRILWIAWILGVTVWGCVPGGRRIYLREDYRSRCPETIAVLPVMNETLDMDAPEVFERYLDGKVAQKGYRVISGRWVREKLAEREIHDAGQIRAIPPDELGPLLGAEALLYTTVTQWRTLYLLAYASVRVGARFELIDSQTGDLLWENEGEIERQRVSIDERSMRETVRFALLQRYEPLVEIIIDKAFGSLPYFSRVKGHRSPLEGRPERPKGPSVRGSTRS